MLIRIYWNFYKSCFPFILAFSCVFTFVFGVQMGVVMLFSLAVVLAIAAVSILKPKEFYFYFNNGITKFKLYKATFIINFFVAIPIALILLLLSSLFGNPKLI